MNKDIKNILKRLEDLERQIFGEVKTNGQIIFKIPEGVPEELQGLGHFWRYPTGDEYITGEYICNNCGVASDEFIKAMGQCRNPLKYSEGGL